MWPQTVRVDEIYIHVPLEVRPNAPPARRLHGGPSQHPPGTGRRELTAQTPGGQVARSGGVQGLISGDEEACYLCGSPHRPRKPTAQV